MREGGGGGREGGGGGGGGPVPGRKDYSERSFLSMPEQTSWHRAWLRALPPR